MTNELRQAAERCRDFLEQLRRDAARYRWLRSDWNNWPFCEGAGVTAEQLDAAVDSAMQKGEGQ